MKAKDILVYAGIGLGGILIGVISTLIVINLITPKSVGLTPTPSLLGLKSVKPESYVAKVGDYYISTEDFNKEYMLVIETLSGGDQSKKNILLNDLSTKKTYLDNVINELVLSIEAYNQGFLASPEWNILSRVSLRKALVDGFLAKKIDLTQIEASPEEIEELYNKNRKYFSERNISAKNAEELLRAQIRSRKLQQKIAEYVKSTRDKFSIEKIEENLK
ncbi:MAG: hypothetical protein ABDH28_00295 [Brevinematia bacterium]